MITVHHLEKSRSHRIIWLLEALAVPYQLRTYQRDSRTLLAPSALKKVHALGKAPVLTDNELTLTESGAIIEYLLDSYGQDAELRPSTEPALTQYRYWLHYAEGSLMPLLVMSLVMSRIGESPTPWLLRPLARMIGNTVKAQYLQPQLDSHLAMIEQHLSQQPWFAGAFSAADMQMAYPLEAAAGRLEMVAYPQIQGFIRRCQALPAYQAALAKGGPVSL
ncbi:glutathione S-transferase [Gallaecimonas sp. GXIMD1310]|uniref:glutathione S-transferase n=1 Tax=Gallaecimonas sp. GXIMD1310 TaxID=3131926 RepID=UPI0032529ABF